MRLTDASFCTFRVPVRLTSLALCLVVILCGQGTVGISADQVELIGLGIGLIAGLGCFCCLQCACARPAKGGGLSRGARARRALASMTGRRGRRAHRAVRMLIHQHICLAARTRDTG